MVILLPLEIFCLLLTFFWSAIFLIHQNLQFWNKGTTESCDKKWLRFSNFTIKRCIWRLHFLAVEARCPLLMTSFPLSFLSLIWLLFSQKGLSQGSEILFYVTKFISTWKSLKLKENLLENLLIILVYKDLYALTRRI